MAFKNRISNKFLALILILCITKVCHSELMCYVCDDCAKVSPQTPQFKCNEEFFNAGGPTSSSIQTTTEHTTTTTENETSATEDTTLQPATISTEETTSTTESKSSEPTTKVTAENVTETTTPKTTEATTVKELETTQETTSTTTEEQPPSPHTEGPPKNTTAVPTPPTPDTLSPLDDVEHLNNRSAVHNQPTNKDEVENVDVEQGTAKPYKASDEIRVRQSRSASDVSFHCFKVKATLANGTMVVNRGCSRVATNESVCGQWESQHPLDKMSKCYPCSRTKCNGSSALSVSITALFVAVIAVFLHRE